MPIKPLTLQELTNHKPAAKVQNRLSAAKRGYGRMHQRWRVMVLARHPICVHCERAGKLTPATEADHIQPLSQGGDWTLENGQGLCVHHHSIKTAREDGGFGRILNK